jgi:hypothetical protein
VTERRGDLAPGAAFEPAPRSALLGATCLRGRAADDQGWLVLLEPDTEGPISGFLARHDEGWAAEWEASPLTADMVAGPCGPESLVTAAPRFGPFRLRAAAATIDR